MAFVQYVGTEPLANTMAPPVVMDARGSSDAASERITFTPADLAGNVLLIRTREINADTVV